MDVLQLPHVPLQRVELGAVPRRHSSPSRHARASTGIGGLSLACRLIRSDPLLRHPATVDLVAEAEGDHDPGDRALLRMLGLDQMRLGVVALMHVDDEQQPALVGRILRGDMDGLLDRRAGAGRILPDLAGLVVQPVHRVEADPHRSGDERRPEFRIEALIIADVVGLHMILVGDARHVAGRGDDPFAPRIGLAGHVERPAGDAGARRAGAGRAGLDPGIALHEREDRHLADAEIEIDRVALVEGVHEVEGDRRRAAEPAHFGDVAVARHDPHHRFRLVEIPHPVRAAGLQPLEIGLQREEGEDGVFLGDREIVHHRGGGPLEPLLADQIAVGVGDQIGDVLRGEPARLVAEEIHIAGVVIDPDMGGDRVAPELPAEIIFADRLQRVRVQLHRPPVLLGGEQLAGVEDGRGVGGAAAGFVLDAGIVRIGIAVAAVERAARLAVVLQPLGQHVAALIIDMAVLDPEHRDHAVAGNVGVLLIGGRILMIGRRAVPAAVDLLRDLALDDEVVNVRLDARRRIHAGEIHGLRKRPGHHPLPALSRRKTGLPNSRRHWQ